MAPERAGLGKGEGEEAIVKQQSRARSWIKRNKYALIPTFSQREKGFWQQAILVVARMPGFA